MAWRLRLLKANLLFVIKETLPCHFENISYPVGLRWCGIVPHPAACGIEKYLKEPWGALLETLLGHELPAALCGQRECLVGALCCLVAVRLGIPRGRRGAAGALQYWAHGSGAASTSFSLIPPLAITCRSCCAQTGKSQVSHPACFVMSFLIEQQKEKAFSLWNGREKKRSGIKLHRKKI